MLKWLHSKQYREGYVRGVKDTKAKIAEALPGIVQDAVGKAMPIIEEYYREINNAIYDDDIDDNYLS